MEKLIVEQLYHPSAEEREVPKGVLRLTQGPIDALRFSGGPSAAQAVVFFHGNKGNITWYCEQARALAARFAGHDVWVFEYVGFGRLGATPPNTERLVVGAYQFLAAIEKRYKAWTWVGESIGAPIALGVLTKLEGKNRVALLPTEIVLVNTFESIGAMADTRQPNSGAFIKKLGYELNTAKYAAQVRERFGPQAPRLRVVRTKDFTEVPVAQAHAVAKAAGAPLEEEGLY